MSKPREVLIYPGSPKTGTTALQAVLRCSVPGLKAAGWNYLRDPQEGEPDALGSGNCMRLFPALAGFSDADPLAEFEALAPAGERSIIAGEALSALYLHQWQPILDLLEAEGGTIRSVYCVRDWYPFVWSAYNQMVSVYRLTEPFTADWMPPPMRLQPMRTIFEGYDRQLPESPCVTSQVFRHYETIRDRVVEEMLLAGGVPLEACDLSPSSLDRPINRSLTQPEVALMRKINAFENDF